MKLFLFAFYVCMLSVAPGFADVIDTEELEEIVDDLDCCVASK